ncbi:MAG TPA: L-threonylcarbamoyladenylate synthase [Acidobacteriota bacterium]
MNTIFAANELDATSLNLCLRVLREGGIICYPTETFYALGIDPWNERARTRLYELKQRSEEKEFPLIVADQAMLQEFCDVKYEALKRLAARFWPGPLTIALPSRERQTSYAVRVSPHPIARQLSAALKGPIVSTSANLSGHNPLSNPDELPVELMGHIDILIHAGPAKGEKLSTIVTLLEDPPRILREGAVTSSEIYATL